jgi:Metallo-peptidase family M12B Reprolysin-like/HYR domain
VKDGTRSGRGATPRSRLFSPVVGLSVVLAALVALPAAAVGAPARAKAPKGVWTELSAKQATAARSGAKPQIAAKRVRTLALDRAGLRGVLVRAPRERTRAAATAPIVVSLPTPLGGFQRFELVRSQIMAPALAAKHPDITTYKGVGIDDPAATIHADLTPQGFHASVRSPRGAWYIDPYFRNRQSVYVSYFGRDTKDVHGPFVERDAQAAELSVDKGYYHASDTVTVRGSEFPGDAEVTLTISDPEGGVPVRTVGARTDTIGSFEATFVADPDGRLGTRIVDAGDGVLASYEIVRDDDPTSDPPTGDVLRTYRLALVTDPGYSAYHGGPANVTPAKVTLVNRVTQLYEEDLSIRLQLIGSTDLLNLDTWDEAIGPNGPCGNAACFSQGQVTSCSNLGRIRIVIGQVIGASNYDIGHLALGQPGGGVANLGVVGRANKAGGCTGLATPIGDFFAVDYVAHEMGHQFSGNHPFNGNQLNCSGGNRSGATSVEPGSGSSIMAYAGICLTDDLQAHSDPYFSQRSLQEISTYTASNQAAINEVQTAALRGFGGGNEVQVVTFGPGYSQAAIVMPLSLNINAAPSATSRGGAQQVGNTVTIATSAVHRLTVGDVVTVAGVAEPGYNGTWTVTAVPTTRSFTYENPVSGLATSGGGTVTLAEPGATSSGTTALIRTAAPHGRSVGDIVTISGVNNAGYNGTFTITGVPSPRSFEYTIAAPLPNAGGGSATYFSPFQVRIGGNDSAVIGGQSQLYNATNIQNAINAIPGFAGTVTVTGAAAAGFTVTYGGASAGVDVPNLALVNLQCGGCFAAVEETNHGGAMDSFRLSYDGNVSGPITNGVDYTAAGIQAALLPLLPAGATVTVAGFGGGTPSNQGFQVTFGGTLALTNVPVLLGLQDFTGSASAFVRETDKGGPVDNKGGTLTPTGNTWPAVIVPAEYTIPLRTPFALTGEATDGESDPMRFIWEQNDRGGTAGTSLLFNTKTNGPLFAMFPKAGVISETDTLLYNSPGQNHIGTSPTRVFPDLQQILDNNTNADTGTCPAGPIAPPVPIPIKECYMEFLPTADYVGFTGFNAVPLSLNFRFTARDGKGGVNAADTRLLLAPTAGPFLVTSHAGGTVSAGSTQTVTWDVANTDLPPVGTTDVKISLSVDGGLTYPHVLAASTANDGSHDVVIPQVVTAGARIKIEAIGNVFFDVSNANLTIADTTPPVLTVPGPIVVNATSPAGRVVTFTATATDNVDPSPTVVCVPPSGSTFPIGTTTVTCTATDASGNSSSASFTVHVKGAAEQLEDLRAAVTGAGPGTSLKSRVEGLLAKLEAGRRGAVCTGLEAFRSEVRAQSGKTLTTAQASELIRTATRISAVLDCG